jgi:serine/threonine-protein kinase HipA
VTDFRSIEELWVFKEDERVATLRRLTKGCEFRCTDDFLNSGQGPIALHLPKTRDGLRVEGIVNLPAYFAGLLPEGLMFSAVRSLIGSAADDLFAVLAATGFDAIGDIDVRVPGESPRKPAIDLGEAAALIKSLVERRDGVATTHLAAIPGVQPKLSLGEIVRASRKSASIAKFDPPEFPGLIKNEFAFMRLAKRCRLDVATVRLEPEALIVTRFDRRFDGAKDRVERVHVEDTLQVMDLFPNSKYSLEYGDLMTAMRELGVSKATLLDALRLYVFSYIIGNGDLHAKNVSLIYDKEHGDWRLSPAYDLLSTLPYGDVLPGADRMALALTDESFGRFTVEEFVDFGLRFGLPERAVQGMVDRTARSVIRSAPEMIRDAVPGEVFTTILERAQSLLTLAAP